MRAKSIIASCYGLACDIYLDRYKALSVRLFQASLVNFRDYTIASDCPLEGTCDVCCPTEKLLINFLTTQETVVNKTPCYSVIDKTLREIEEFTEECIIPVVTIEEIVVIPNTPVPESDLDPDPEPDSEVPILPDVDPEIISTPRSLPSVCKNMNNTIQNTAGVYNFTADDDGMIFYSWDPEDIPTYLRMTVNGAIVYDRGCQVNISKINKRCQDNCPNVTAVMGAVNGSFEIKQGDKILVDISINCCEGQHPFCIGESELSAFLLVFSCEAPPNVILEPIPQL